jgi:hypothetical protein
MFTVPWRARLTTLNGCTTPNQRLQPSAADAMMSSPIEEQADRVFFMNPKRQP